MNIFEQFLLLFFGAVAWWLSHKTLKTLFAWIYRKRADEKFVTEFRQTPMLTFVVAIPYFLLITIIYFKLIATRF